MSLVRPVALAFTALTGFSGLVYEVTWQKYLATLVGSHAEAAAAVLGIFLAGLSIGYGVFGRWSERRVRAAAAGGRPARLLAVYGGVEIGIGLYAFAFPMLFQGIEALSISMPIEDSGIRFLVDVMLTIVLIGPSAVMMGATVPFLTQALPVGVEDASRLHAQVYALNTVGGCFGALAAAFWLVPNLGLVDSMYAVGLVNLFAGAGFLGLEWRTSAAANGEASQDASDPKAEGIVFSSARAAEEPFASGILPLATAALLSGFAMMTLQTAVIRLAGLSFGSSPFAFASVVSVFVLCIALGSLTVGLVRRINPAALVVSQALLVGLLLMLYWPLSQAPYWAYRLRVLFPSEVGSFLPYWLSTVAMTALVIGPAIALSGAMLPLLFDRLNDDPDRLGEVSGRLYRWNTVGSLFGALLGGYWLLHWLDLDGVFRVAVVALVAMTGLLIWVTRGGEGARRIIVSVLCLSLFVVALPSWDRDLLSIGLFRKRTLDPGPVLGVKDLTQAMYRGRVTTFYDDDPVQSVAVRETVKNGERSLALVNNGKSEGSTKNDRMTMRLAALLPAVLAERVERAFVIGLGTGMTAGQLAALDSVSEVVVSEISPAVIEALPLFDDETFGASRSPKIELVEGDAYRQLSRERTQYDVIVSEPSNPWVAGVEMLYSEEFLTAARDRLRPGGIYVQWFHQYETSDETIEVILRTYSTVFAETAIWYSQQADVLVLGFAEAPPPPSVMLERLLERASDPEVAAGLAGIGIMDAPGLLAHEIAPVGVVSRSVAEGQIHRLRFPILGDIAGRGFFVGGEGSLPYFGLRPARAAGLARSLLRAYADRTSEAGAPKTARRKGLGLRLNASEWVSVLDQSCQYNRWQCAALMADALATHRGAPALEAWRSARRAEINAGVTDYTAYLPAVADALAPLFGGPLPRPGTVAREDAFRMLAMARVTYQPSRPFDQRALQRVWEACPTCDRYRGNLDRFLDEGLLPMRLAPAR